MSDNTENVEGERRIRQTFTDSLLNRFTDETSPVGAGMAALREGVRSASQRSIYEEPSIGVINPRAAAMLQDLYSPSSLAWSRTGRISIQQQDISFTIRTEEPQESINRKMQAFSSALTEMHRELFQSLDIRDYLSGRINPSEAILQAMARLCGKKNDMKPEQVNHLIQKYLEENLELKVTTESVGSELDVKVELTDISTKKTLAEDSDSTEIDFE